MSGMAYKNMEDDPGKGKITEQADRLDKALAALAEATSSLENSLDRVMRNATPQVADGTIKSADSPEDAPMYYHLRDMTARAEGLSIRTREITERLQL